MYGVNISVEKFFWIIIDVRVHLKSNNYFLLIIVEKFMDKIFNNLLLNNLFAWLRLSLNWICI